MRRRCATLRTTSVFKKHKVDQTIFLLQYQTVKKKDLTDLTDRWHSARSSPSWCCSVDCMWRCPALWGNSTSVLALCSGLYAKSIVVIDLWKCLSPQHIIFTVTLLSQACLFDGVKTVTRNSLLHIVSLWQQKVFLPPHIFSYSYHRVLFFFLLFLSRHLYSAILPEDVGHDKCCKKQKQPHTAPFNQPVSYSMLHILTHEKNHIHFIL